MKALLNAFRNKLRTFSLHRARAAHLYVLQQRRDRQLSAHEQAIIGALSSKNPYKDDRY